LLLSSDPSEVDHWERKSSDFIPKTNTSPLNDQSALYLVYCQ